MAGAQAIRHADAAANIVVVSDDPNPFYYRPALTNHLIGALTDRELWAVPPYVFAEQNFERRAARVKRVEPEASQIQLGDGSSLKFDALLIAAGARPRMPSDSLPGVDLMGVMGFRTLQDTRLVLDYALKSGRAVVVGGGILGLELAQGLHANDIEVEFLIRGERFWPAFLDNVASDLIISRMRSAGVQVHTNAEVAEIRGDQDHVSEVVLKDGRTFGASAVGYAIGVTPNVEFLEGSGLELGRGIVVDERMHTNIPNIYAAGDIVQVTDPKTNEPQNPTQLWLPARLQGRTAGANMVRAQARYQPGELYMATRLWDLDFGLVGQPAPREGEFESVIYQPRGEFVYKQAAIRDGHLLGALLLGDRSDGYLLKSLIDDNEYIGSIKDRLFDSDFDLAAWIKSRRGLTAPETTSALITPNVGLPSIRDLLGAPIVQIEDQTSTTEANVKQTAWLMYEDSKVFLDASALNIGRAKANDIMVSDPAVSKRHAQIARQGNEYFLSDLSSLNGTFLNNDRVDWPRRLQAGDVIEIGSARLLFQIITAPIAVSLPKEQDEISIGWLEGPDDKIVIGEAPWFSIGRGDDNDIVLPSKHVSLRHAQLERRPDGLYLLDLGSLSGTRVNSFIVALPNRLRHGDLIEFADLSFRFHWPDDDMSEDTVTLGVDLPTQEIVLQAAVSVTRGPNLGISYALKGPAVVGRSQKVDITIATQAVSREHCKLEPKGTKCLLTDLDSFRCESGPPVRRCE